MQFNFVLTNHRAAELQALDDILRPLIFGLREAGHRVVAGIRQFGGPPAINVMVEDFSDPATAQEIAAARGAWGPGFRLGVLCPHEFRALAPARADGLRAVLPALDFVWSLAPLDLLAPERRAVVRYGFHDSLLGPRLIADSAGRDLDVVVYGPNSPRLDALVERLAAAQLRHFPVRAGTFPDYIVTDLLSRAKAVAVVGGASGADAALGPRALKSMCNGALVVAEEGSIVDELAGLLASCSYDDIPATCRRIAEGRFAERGLEALERLRQMPGMRVGLAAALAVAAGRA
ncbi:MAG: hypothetical protein JO128_17840 [Alphaproteobacteria bacterium]|nr:hypothetical protein [Alphaproteobacteria bacterium]